jgi:hypothetical protein
MSTISISNGPPPANSGDKQAFNFTTFQARLCRAAWAPAFAGELGMTTVAVRSDR